MGRSSVQIDLDALICLYSTAYIKKHSHHLTEPAINLLICLYEFCGRFLFYLFCVKYTNLYIIIIIIKQ